MAQGVLPYKYEEEKTQSGITALAGLPVYLDLASVMGLSDHIHRHMHVKNRGWTDEQTILSLILLNSQEATLLMISRCSKKTKVSAQSLIV